MAFIALELALARTSCADSAAETRHTLASARQKRKRIFKLCQLHLQFTLARPCPCGKISSMSMVLSTTLVSVLVSILLICDGVSSLSAIIRSISLFRQKAATSDILPLPIYVAGDGASSFCITVPIISAPAVSERRANSSIEISALYSPVSTPIKSALSGL